MKTEIRRINRDLMVGWAVIVTILVISYVIEYNRGQRDLYYVLLFFGISILPLAIAIRHFQKKPKDAALRYYAVIGFSLMYVFVMLTGNTMMVFVYVLPLLAFLVLYHDKNLILISWVGASILNIGCLFLWKYRGMLRECRDHEIQLAAVFLCFLAAYFAARIYADITRENTKFNEELEMKNEQMSEMTMQTIMTIANTIDAKDEYTRGHSRRVAEYSAAIARELGFSEEDVEDIRFIGLLHDIGKIGVPDAVLNKPGRLTDEEYQLMKGHTMVGADILKDITMIDGLDVGAKYHHEHYDGTGYPEGLKGDEIPRVARIIGVADAYDAMTSNRVYRRHLEPDRVMKELKKGCGNQFEPEACEALIRLVEENRLPKVSLDSDTKMVKQATTILTRVIDKAEDKAADEKNLDELTGAFSKNQGKGIIQEAINEFGAGSLFLFDIDGFRKINETEGYAVGDMYLKATADMIRELGGEQFMVRYGSDEFMLYLPHVETADEAENLADFFITNMREKAAEDPTLSKLSVCIGITQIATEKDKVSVACENAGKALYVAKQCNIGTFFCHRLEGDDDDIAVADSVDLMQLVEAMSIREEVTDGYATVYPGFGVIYDTVSNIVEEYLRNVHVVLFTMHDSTGGVTAEEREKVIGVLERALQEVLEEKDEMIRYSRMQWLAVFPEQNEHDVRAKINKIMLAFYKMYDRREIEIHYDAADLRRN